MLTITRKNLLLTINDNVIPAIYQNVGQSATLITTSGNLLLEAE